MTGAEQLEQWLEPFKRDPQDVVNSCWKAAGSYSQSSILKSDSDSLCSYAVTYGAKAWRFLSLLSAGDLKAWLNFAYAGLLFVAMLSAIALFEFKWFSKDKGKI